MIKKKYKVYPDEIKVGKYYWHRKKNDYTMNAVKIVSKYKENMYLAEYEESKILKVEKDELLIFDPASRLFKALMRLASFRSDPFIKKILYKMDLKPEIFLRTDKESINTHDENIIEDEFFNEYINFIKNDHCFSKETIENIKNLIVTGTSNLDIYNLYKKVCQNGGMERITDDQRWKHLFYSDMSKTNVSYTIRTFYKKYLYEFEISRRSVEKEFDYDFKFNINDNVYLYSDSQIYYGTIKLRRNRGLNQYYLHFVGWSKEYCEWYCEDVLFFYDKELTNENKMKRKTRSSKANNIIDDPLTREKHSHIGAKIIKFDSQSNIKNHFDHYDEENYNKDKKQNLNFNEKKIDFSLIKNNDAIRNLITFRNSEINMKNKKINLIHENEYDVLKNEYNKVKIKNESDEENSFYYNYKIPKRIEKKVRNTNEKCQFYKSY
ncbi:AT-rich interactive domain-containing protein [Gurleya vavrai]